MMPGHFFKMTCLKDTNCSKAVLRYFSVLLTQGRNRKSFSTVLDKRICLNRVIVQGAPQPTSSPRQIRNMHHSLSCCALPMMVSSNPWSEMQNAKKPVRSIALTGGDVVCITFNTSPPYSLQVRHKSKKKQMDTQEAESESDDDDILEEDDFDAPPKFKVMKIHVASMRADAIISNALDVARNKMEETFLGSGLLLNGSKMLKKSIKMDAGDYADLIVEKADDQLKVKRVKVIKIYPEKTSKEKFLVKVRVWKAPFAVAKPDSSHKDSR